MYNIRCDLDLDVDKRAIRSMPWQDQKHINVECTKITYIYIYIFRGFML